MKIQLTNFALRHFRESFAGTKVTDISPENFVKKINREEITNIPIINTSKPFCKLQPVRNFTNARVGTMRITMDNYQYLHTSYSARTAGELPTLTRFFSIPYQFIPKAKYLMLVLYTREQLLSEHIENCNDSEFELDNDTDYGIVAILGQSHRYEEPMKPATMIRNHMGRQYGGSGHPLDENEYLTSVAFWSKHEIVKPL